MAVSLIAGIIAGASTAIVTGAFSWLAFGIVAGMSMITRALTPKLDLGAQMGGRSVMTRDAASSRKIIYGRARVGGNVVYLESTGTDNKYLWLVTAIAGHEIDAYEEVWFNDEKIWDGGSYVGNWGSYVSISFKDGSQTTADSNLVAASTKWTSNHKLLDTAYIVIKLTYDQEQFAQGLPNISTVVRGKKVWHPNNSSPVWSQNPALCLRDYLTDTKYGLGESASNIASINTAFNVCNETVALAAGGTQPRYTIDGVIDTGDSLKSNIELMVGSMAGRLIYASGKFEIHAGKYVAPTVTIDESQILGEIKVQTKQSRRNGYNAVKGVFLSEEDNYVLADYPAQLSKTTAGSFVTGNRYKILTIDGTDFTAIGASANTVGLNFKATGAGSGSGTASLFLAEDDEQIYLDMPLPLTVNNIRAQRLARLALLRSRQQEAITMACNLSALRFNVGDNINITNARLGYSQKVFEVTGYSTSFDSSGEIIINVQAIETASSVWNWSSTDEEVFLGGGEVALYDGSFTERPASIAVSADSYMGEDGTFRPYFSVTWPASVDAFVDHYIVEWRTGSGDYLSQATRTSPFQITNLQDGASYNVRVKAVNGLGVQSLTRDATPTAATDTTAPSVPTSISATAGYKSISLKWTNPSEKDFNNVEIYRATTSSGTYAEVSNVSGGFGSKAEHLDGGLADATAFYYKFKSVDESGNKSAFSSVVNATTNAASIDGSDGKSTFTAPIFKRASSAPSAPSGGSFNFGTNTLTPPSGWSTTVPSGTDPIYQANFQFSITGDTGSQTAGTWSTPVVIAENGTDGTNGLSTFVFPVYKRASSSPTTPSGGSYNFTNNTITAPSGWSSSVPSGTDPIYVSTTQAQISGATGTDSSLSWTPPILFVQNGISGSDGKSTFTAPVFKRATSAPSAPNGGTFNFGTNALTPPTGWAIAVPSGTNPIYQANFQFSISGDTGTVTAGTWSTPVIIAENGDDGIDGLSTFTFAVHKRATSTPNTPSGGSYNFGTNTITAPSGWSEAIPSGTDPIYISSTRAQISGATGTDSSLSWTAPIVFAINGDNGGDGVNTAPVYAYKRSSSTLGSTDKPTTTRTWTFANASFGNNDLGNSWTGEVPSGTDDLYICAAVASSTGATDSVVAADWSAPQVLGTKGEDGDNGVNTAVVYGYKRSASTVTDKPSTTRTWTFSSGTFNNNDLGNSFTGEIPSGTNELYVCTAVASSVNSTDSVTGTSDWSAPQLLAAEGTDGTDGFNTAVVYGYKRSSSTVTNKPSTTRTWTFSTGTFNNNDLGNGFTGEIPTGTDDLYACTAVATSQSSTDSVTGTSDWSAPQLLSSNGENGAAGVRNASGYVYYSQTSANAPSAPTASAYNFGTGVFSSLTSNWSRTPPVNTGGDAKYWATSYYVTEATYNGTQTITFGTVFNSVTFDGLVTFTNLNSALASEGGNVTTIDGGLIETDSIVVSKLSGDVTEVYPIGIEVNNSMGTGGTTTYQDIWIPAPSLGISKRQRISADFTFSIQNSSSTNYSAYFQYGLQYKGKTNIGTSVGTVTHVSFPASYRQYVSLAGNVLDKIDNVGGVAKTNNGAGTYGVASIVGVSYDADDDKTYVLMANIATTFATGDTLYFSVNRFESAGTFVANYTSLQTKMIFANTTERFSLPLQQFFGSSTTATNVRPYVIASTNMNNLTGYFNTVKGTMENIA